LISAGIHWKHCTVKVKGYFGGMQTHHRNRKTDIPRQTKLSIEH